MWYLIVSVPNHCLSFYISTSVGIVVAHCRFSRVKNFTQWKKELCDIK